MALGSARHIQQLCKLLCSSLLARGQEVGGVTREYQLVLNLDTRLALNLSTQMIQPTMEREGEGEGGRESKGKKYSTSHLARPPTLSSEAKAMLCSGSDLASDEVALFNQE